MVSEQTDLVLAISSLSKDSADIDYIAFERELEYGDPHDVVAKAAILGSAAFFVLGGALCWIHDNALYQGYHDGIHVETFRQYLKVIKNKVALGDKSLYSYMNTYRACKRRGISYLDIKKRGIKHTQLKTMIREGMLPESISEMPQERDKMLDIAQGKTSEDIQNWAYNNKVPGVKLRDAESFGPQAVAYSEPVKYRTFKIMAFDEQADIINEAINRFRQVKGTPDIPASEALFYIVADWYANGGGDVISLEQLLFTAEKAFGVQLTVLELEGVENGFDVA